MRQNFIIIPTLSRFKKKVSSLMTAVSELKKENLVSSDCANIVEETFYRVFMSFKELIKRSVTQKTNPGAHPKELPSIRHGPEILL